MTAQADDLKPVLQQRLVSFNEHALFKLPALSDHQLNRLDQRKVVKIRQTGSTPDEPQRVIGLLVVDQPRDQLWVAARDPHYNDVEEITNIQLTPGSTGRERWYQHLELPRLFADRHWVIDVWDNHAMPQGTDGMCWEHPWQHAPDGMTLITAAMDANLLGFKERRELDRAVFVDWNDGAWINISLTPSITLIGFHAATVVGGAIPDRLVADYAMLTAGKVLYGIRDRGPTVWTHHDAAHTTLERGDGTVIRAPASDL